MTKQPRLTQLSLTALRHLMEVKQQCGADITRATGIRPGVVYPMLRRLEASGWLTSKWVQSDYPDNIGRPLKRVYSLTHTGRSQARDVLSSLQ